MVSTVTRGGLEEGPYIVRPQVKDQGQAAPLPDGVGGGGGQLEQPRPGHGGHVSVHTQPLGEEGQKEDEKNIVGDGHAALEVEVVHGLEQPPPADR